jgi:hypothetical protein
MVKYLIVFTFFKILNEKLRFWLIISHLRWSYGHFTNQCSALKRIQNADIRQILECIGVVIRATANPLARGQPLWDGDDAQADAGVEPAPE